MRNIRERLKYDIKVEEFEEILEIGKTKQTRKLKQEIIGSSSMCLSLHQF